MGKWKLTGFCGLLFLLMLLTACSGSSSEANGDTAAGSDATPSQAAASEPVTLRIFTNLTEASDAFKVLKEKYEAEFPNVTLEIDATGDNNFGTAMKARMAAGEMPDIFTNSGGSELGLWGDYMEDLSSEAWISEAQDNTLNNITVDGKVYGFPLTISGFGFMYNKDLFAKAGITEVPATMTTLKEAVDKLNAAGIPAFIPPFGEWYTPGVFEANNPVAKQADPVKFLADLTAGSDKITGNQLFMDWLDLFMLEVKNANKNVLTIDYTTMVTDFANGEGAITLGSSFSQPLLDQINPDVNLGVMPMPINDDAELNDKIFVGVSAYLAVNKDSKVKDEAKKLLNWLAASETGKAVLVNDFKFIPTMKGVETTPEAVGSIGSSMMEYIDAGKTLSYYYNDYPEGLTTEWGTILQEYAAERITKEQTLERFQAAWDQFNK
ncbi:ABC transporter substrate-binding protein [Paenibacillus sp. S150]|uniref:ABC transporter substrate-binding protein n=1 Tax=Paenibacillus sp. S150 TaxID=2749826 RepID=UPI001C5613DC|nr:ABC transporter substrate-binding protein [Paenibacillus sp. S150]MBW4081190.1 carbohydrate ABC transporter substrate-binding protein [Paenibacillus sp. S150]